MYYYTPHTQSTIQGPDVLDVRILATALIHGSGRQQAIYHRRVQPHSYVSAAWRLGARLSRWAVLWPSPWNQLFRQLRTCKLEWMHWQRCLCDLQTTLQPSAEVLTFLDVSATKCQLELSCHSLRCRNHPGWLAMCNFPSNIWWSRAGIEQLWACAAKCILV